MSEQINNVCPINPAIYYKQLLNTQPKQEDISISTRLSKFSLPLTLVIAAMIMHKISPESNIYSVLDLEGTNILPLISSGLEYMATIPTALFALYKVREENLNQRTEEKTWQDNINAFEEYWDYTNT